MKKSTMEGTEMPTSASPVHIGLVLLAFASWVLVVAGCAPRPGRRSVGPAIDLAEGKELLGTGGYLLLNAEETFLGVVPPSDSALKSCLTTGDVYMIGCSRDFIVGKAYRDAGGGMPDTDVAPSYFIIEVGTRNAHTELSEAEYAQLRRKLGVPADVKPVSTLKLWPAWSGTNRRFRRNEQALKFLGLMPLDEPGSQELPGTGGYGLLNIENLYLALLAPELEGEDVIINPWGDIYMIGWDERFIVAKERFLKVSTCPPLVDSSRGPAYMILDRNGYLYRYLTQGEYLTRRQKLGVPNEVELKRVDEVWPDWVGHRRPWGD